MIKKKGVHKSLLQLERRQQAALFAARDTPHKHAALNEQLANLDLMFDRLVRQCVGLFCGCRGFFFGCIGLFCGYSGQINV